ncbi:MAG: T9SS type A sorting domain-containing protein [Flavobacteriales bacterium]|nr:T9SS type A sorting domain-containing protein [Flavobacteriales bacterium]
MHKRFLGIGIGDVDNMPLQGVRVFPNPADGLFNLELELQGMVSLVVFDSRGRQVMNQTFMANSSKTLRVLDLSRAAAGTYSLQVSTSEGSVQQFLVRE